MLEIDNFIDECIRTKNAYFWQPPSYASGRRNYEKNNTIDLDIEFPIYQYKRQKVIEFRINVKANLHLTCSCKNIYRYCTIEINGIKCNLTVLKHLNEIEKENKQLTSQFIKKYGLIPNLRSKSEIVNEECNR